MAPKYLPKPRNAEVERVETEEQMLLRFEHPKVLCVDLEEAALQTLRAAGYRVVAGTLGQPYFVERSDTYARPFTDLRLPGFSEQEIVVVQHHPPEPVANPTGLAPLVTRETVLWASCRSGVVDTRPYGARLSIDGIQRILDFGGIVINFWLSGHDRR